MVYMLPCQRNLFSLPDDDHYVNCAYMSPLLKSVEKAGIEGIRRRCAPSRIKSSMFFNECDNARDLFGQIIGASGNQVAIISATSYGVATVARNVPLRRGQNIVLLHEQFPSNVYSWQRIASESGATVRTVQCPRCPDRCATLTARIIDAIDHNTAAVAVGPVHWTDGALIDLTAIGERASDVGAFFVVDGTQSVGALPIDPVSSKIDALICSAYKWLMGPYGLGAMYLSERLLDGIPLEESWLTRSNSTNFTKLVKYCSEYHEGATRYDVGGRTNFVAVPMMIRGFEQILEWGPHYVQEYCQALMQDALGEISALGYEVAPGSSSHLFGIISPAHVSSTRLSEALAKEGVSVSLRGSAIRISPHVYNNQNDVAALYRALDAAVTVGSPTYSITA